MKSLAREDTAAPSLKTMETTSLAWVVTRPKNTEMTLIMPGGDERGTTAANTLPFHIYVITIKALTDNKFSCFIFIFLWEEGSCVTIIL